MEKSSVSNITVPVGFVVVTKALAMARLLVVATPSAIVPPPPSQFRLLAPYCPFSSPLPAKTPPPAGILLLPSGLHPTATHRLAPYCDSLAGTLLLLFRSFDISKKINLRPAASCPPCAPDVAGAYKVNSSSGCGRNQKLSPPATLRPADNPTVPLHPMHPPACYPFPDVLRLQSPSP